MLAPAQARPPGPGHHGPPVGRQVALLISDPPVVYTAEKRNVMYVLDARTGAVLKRFRSGGATAINTESCAPQVTGLAES